MLRTTDNQPAETLGTGSTGDYILTLNPALSFPGVTPLKSVPNPRGFPFLWGERRKQILSRPCKLLYGPYPAYFPRYSALTR